MRLWLVIFALGFMDQCTQGQDRSTEKVLRQSLHAKDIQHVKKRQWERVRTVTYHDYADSVFPNEALLRLKNLEAVSVWGRTMVRERRMVAVPPIVLRVDTVKLKELPRLKHVSLSCFDMRFPPEGLSAIAELEGLSLSICHLERLPKDIGRMRSLRALDLRVNYLDSLPPEIADLDSLRSIDLVNNHFRRVPMTLAGCASLERIHLQNDEGGHADYGIEKEWVTTSFNWPFPVCANHIDWRASRAELEILLQQPQLEFIRLHARDCRGERIAQLELDSKKIQFRKPFECPDRLVGRLISAAPKAPMPLDMDQRKCICTGLGF
jgi:hypothetical protein